MKTILLSNDTEDVADDAHGILYRTSGFSAKDDRTRYGS